MNATELFDELRAQYPGRWHRGQLMAFRSRVRLWREDARARGVEIGRLRYRQSSIPRTRRRPDPLEANWAEMLQALEADPDQTSQELLAAFMIQYPDRYAVGHLRTVQRRMKIWRHDAVEPSNNRPTLVNVGRRKLVSFARRLTNNAFCAIALPASLPCGN
jgi:hypothetical protein